MTLTFLYPLIGLVLGVIITLEIQLSPLWALFAFALGFLIWLVLHALSKDPLKGISIIKWHPLWVVSLFIGIGISDAYFMAAPYNVPDSIIGLPLKIEGTVADVRSYASGDQLRLKVETLKNNSEIIQPHNLLIRVNTDGLSVCPGDIISFQGVLNRFPNENKGTEAYVRVLKHEGILYFSSLKSSETELIRRSSSLKYWFQHMEEKCKILLEKSSLDKSVSNFLISLILGDKTFMNPYEKETVTNAGLAHILALSGMHIGIILLIATTLLFPVALLGHPKLYRSLSIILVWFYVFITGCSPSTIRAAIMMSLVLLAFLTERKNSPFNALLAAAFIIVFFDPFSIWNIGFQMSFLCVAVILLFVEKLNPIDRHSSPRLFNVINVCLISLSVSLATWVLTIYYFKSIPLLFLPANLLLLPLLPFFVIGGIIFLLFLTLGFDITPLAYVLNKFHSFYLYAATFLSGEGKSVLHMGIDLSTVILWLTGVMLMAVALYCRHHKRIWKTASYVCFMLSFIFLFAYEEPKLPRLVFHHSFTSIQVSVKDDELSGKLTFSRQAVSQSNISGCSIAAIDCPIKTEFLDSVIPTSNLKHFLIVGPGADLRQIATIISNHELTHVILHANIGNKQKESLLSLLDEELHYKVHSLRDEGSLEFTL